MFLNYLNEVNPNDDGKTNGMKFVKKYDVQPKAEVKADEDDDIFDVVEEGMSKVVADAEAAIDEVAEKIMDDEKKPEAEEVKEAEESDETEELTEIDEETSEEFFDDDEV